MMPKWLVSRGKMPYLWYPEFFGTFDGEDFYYDPKEPNHHRGLLRISNRGWKIAMAPEGPLPIGVLAALRLRGLV